MNLPTGSNLFVTHGKLQTFLRKCDSLSFLLGVELNETSICKKLSDTLTLHPKELKT